MGKEIEKVALSRGHEIVATIDNEEEWKLRKELFLNADVAIEFSTPGTVVDNILRCFESNMPIVVGTTGWNSRKEEIEQLCKENQQCMLASSNFSIGVNILFEINKHLARLMNKFHYDVEITETHHIHKLDAPSGTAITLAEGVMEELDSKSNWSLNPQKDTDLKITSIREGEIPGIHEVKYENEIDSLSISHSAKSRRGLAEGAVWAAEYIVNQKNMGNHRSFSMADLMK